MLTQKQEKFVQGLIAGKSQREAYKAAYDCKRMKDNSIDNTACKLLKKPKIAQRYEELRHAAEDKAGDDAVSMRAKLIEHWKNVLRTDIANFYTIKNVSAEGITVTLASLKDLSKMDTSCIQELSFDGKGGVKIKCYSKDVAAQALERLYGITAEEKEAKAIEVVLPEELEGMDG
ncbi:terminase small subunit [Lachnoclostridium sp. Marseille-P6806]|uniref:terminase small subunit n=1 Tax=Lachnoclostridium sp. Marseille-P6806 TaxID=2364793 RepID=UPI001031A7CB|nr:terminase small subunit [Lachnoclostridium sp. Marseille-P6806]